MKASDITKKSLPELRRKERLRGLPDTEVVQHWYKAADEERGEHARKIMREILPELDAEYDRIRAGATAEPQVYTPSLIF